MEIYQVICITIRRGSRVNATQQKPGRTYEGTLQSIGIPCKQAGKRLSEADAGGPPRIVFERFTIV